MKFGKLRLKNYVPFKSATFDLDYEGITHIQAQNRDAENNNGKATNAAGKSRLFGAIPEAVWGKSPTGKDGVKTKSTAGVGFEVKDVGESKDTFEIIRRFGKKKGFTISRNGKDLKVRTIDLGEKRAQEILGMSEADFYTRVYLDSQITHPLIVGTAKHRQEFFVDMFNLHSVDSTRKLLLAEYREAQKNRAAYLEIRSMFDELREKAIGEDALAKKKAALSELKARQEALLEKFRKTQRVRDLVMFEADNSALIEKVLKLGDLDEFESLSQECRRKLKAAKALQEEAVAWRVYDKEKVAYKEKLRPIRAKLGELLGATWESERQHCEKRAKKAREAQAELQLAKSALKACGELGDKPEGVDEPKYTYEEANRRVERFEEELAHAKEFHDGKCPTCGSSVKARSVDDIKADVKKWKQRRAQANEYKKYAERLEQWKDKKAEITKVTAAYEDAKVVAAKGDKWLEAQTLFNSMPDLPEAPGAERPDVDGIGERIEKLQKRLSTFEQAKPVIDKIREVAALTDKQRASAKAFNSLGDELTEINNAIGSLTAEITSARDAHANLNKMADRGKALKRKAADEPVLKALVDLHSKKGLKKLMIERQAKRLEDQINKFRKLLFTEDFKFEFRYDKQLDILVHRRVGKVDSVSDVRKLSGAERRMFAILLVVATITLMPKNKRSNVLILDEPEANLGPAAQNNFVRALPILNKIIPHIVVVSPRTDLEIPGARVFTIVKHQGKSTIHKGAIA